MDHAPRDLKSSSYSHFLDVPPPRVSCVDWGAHLQHMGLLGNSHGDSWEGKGGQPSQMVRN